MINLSCGSLRFSLPGARDRRVIENGRRRRGVSGVTELRALASRTGLSCGFFIYLYFLLATVFEVYKVVFCLEVMNYDWIFVG